jgi:DNA repair protein RadC
VIAFKELFAGTLNGNAVYPREVENMHSTTTPRR